MGKLSESELYCWNYLQDNIEKIPNMTITEVAKNSFVSLATVGRTLNKMGYDGYSEFKGFVKNSIKNSDRQVSKKTGFSNEVAEIIKKNEIEVTRTIEQLQPEDIKATMKLIQEHESIGFFSLGLSSYVAKEMSKKLRLWGKFCQVYDHVQEMEYYADKVSRDTLIFVISLNGETKEIIKSAEICHLRNIKMIVLTANPASHLTNLSDIFFLSYKTKLNKSDSGIDVASRISLSVLGRIIIDSYILYKNLRPIVSNY